MNVARELLRTFIQYAEWANNTMIAACASFPTADLERDLGAPHSSILHTLRHIYLSDLAWRDRIVSDSLPPLNDIGTPERFAGSAIDYSLEDLRRHWAEIPRSLLFWLNDVDDAYLNGEMSCALPSGGDLRLTRAEILLHHLNHSTLHRGQIILMIRSEGVKPPNLDIFSYYLHRD